ncbi:CHAT domain-containing protein [Sphingobium fontiphilum]|uniref:CHAT domain-containing protein n=1 Tax=Sphingobium fontiphilum TaxID=944425 RepID=A0A7W6DH36_9SPHN|nr:CHAT domain-containing protein [Sphingobium fontiphilum]MBB3980532.1 CHAT domain-containing protein [Sphingobium fontiphilum]
MALLLFDGSTRAKTASTALHPRMGDSFPVGNGQGGMCQAQAGLGGKALHSIFDRSWSIVCRDSTRPVGRLYALRDAGQDDVLLARIAPDRPDAGPCTGEPSITLPDVGTATTHDCQPGQASPAYRVIIARIGRTAYVAQGFAAYDSALTIGLRSVALDQLIDEPVAIASLGGSDAAAFARLQADVMDPQAALGEAYRRNASGAYAEAAAYFDTLADRLEQRDEAATNPALRAAQAHEYAVNRALQLSNLGEFEQADAIFAQAKAIPIADGVQLRLRRNLMALHAINRGALAEALSLLDAPLPDYAPPALSDGDVVISARTANDMNAALPLDRALGRADAARLTSEERAAILDAQALQMRGTIARLSGDARAAMARLDQATAAALSIRAGNVVSITRLRTQILGEMALAQEAQGNGKGAESTLRSVLALLEARYPETMAMNGARARLGSFLARNGRGDEAIDLYRTVIRSTNDNRASLTGISNQIQPYFTLLTERLAKRPELADDLFLATQTLVRPGAAETLEQLARGFSAGSGEGSRLFRRSVSLTRDLERKRVEIAQWTESEGPDSPQAAAARAVLSDLAVAQTRTLAGLAAYPQYRAVNRDALTLTDLRATLHPGEAYFKLAQVGDTLFAVWVDGTEATGYRLPISATALAAKVAALRATISTNENGVQTTYPLDVAIARALFLDIFGPVEARLTQTRHLIFEPDGAMLSLPVNLLITQQSGVDAYLARTANPQSDPFDFRGIAWLGRDHMVSTALSARAFADSRAAAPSGATKAYLGLGENARLLLAPPARIPVGAAQPGGDCGWPGDQWNHPISASELRQAASAFPASRSEILTGSAFTDAGLFARDDLDSFRILHFATHGLVTPPKPQCPARPALVTSFSGGGQSNGLLEFGEIFDLKLDADMVILSACDTAGAASVQASRAAGLRGGGSALDGLVRAFIGAGGRSVIASHWPAPDEFRATERLMSGLFSIAPGEPVGEALRLAQLELMDSAETSHPFYWSGFALIGDGARPLILSR